MTNLSNIRSKIISYIVEHDISPFQLSKNLGVASSIVFKIMGEYPHEPSLKNLIKIADGLNCSLDELVGRNFNIKNTNINLKELAYYHQLLISSCDQTFIFLKNNKSKIPKDITLEQIIDAIEVIYKISIKNDDVVANPKTVETVLSNIFSLSKK